MSQIPVKFVRKDKVDNKAALVHVDHQGQNHNTVKPVYNDHLMGYFSAFWSSSRWPGAT